MKQLAATEYGFFANELVSATYNGKSLPFRSLIWFYGVEHGK